MVEHPTIVETETQKEPDLMSRQAAVTILTDAMDAYGGRRPEYSFEQIEQAAQVLQTEHSSE